MSEHTTTEVVKDAACWQRRSLGEPRGVDPERFDRWLEQERRKWQAEALDRAATVLPFPADPYGGFDHESLRAAQIQHCNVLRDMAQELRAAELENGEER